MKKDVKILLRKGSIFIIPIIIWMILVVVVDPFNYFNISKNISKESKIESAQKLNSLLYNLIEFKNNPQPNIIIGDSRIRKLPTDRIKEITGDSYYTLHANAAKFNEIIDLFWEANKYSRLENVILGINFNIFNEYAYSDRVSDAKELIETPLMYIFNQDILETVFLALKNHIIGIKKEPKRDGKKFWKYTINTTAKNQYSKWKKPKKILERLKEVDTYCKEKNINLTLLIVPNHRDFHSRLVEFKLSEEEHLFKQDIKMFSNVIDYDFSNKITNCRNCFGDPLHTTDSISKVIVEDIFINQVLIGKTISTP